MDTLWLVTIILAILFGVATISGLYVGIAGLRRKRLGWAVRSYLVIHGRQPLIPGLKILYQDQQVENVTVSRLAFWNTGSATIRAGDISLTEPLRIEAREGVSLLDVELLKSTTAPSPLSHDEDPERRQSTIQFEHLEVNRGAVFQVVHSGTSSLDISLQGYVVDGGPPRLRRIRIVRSLPLPTTAAFDLSLRVQTRRRIALAVALSPLLLVLALATLLLIAAAYVIETQPEQIVMYIYGSVAGSLAVLVAAYVCIRYSRGRLPNGLEAYEEDLEA